MFKRETVQVSWFQWLRATNVQLRSSLLRMALLVTPQTESSLKCPVTEFAHVLPFKRECREGWCMVKKRVGFLRGDSFVCAVGLGV